MKPLAMFSIPGGRTGIYSFLDSISVLEKQEHATFHVNKVKKGLANLEEI